MLLSISIVYICMYYMSALCVFFITVNAYYGLVGKMITKLCEYWVAINVAMTSVGIRVWNPGGWVGLP